MNGRERSTIGLAEQLTTITETDMVTRGAVAKTTSADPVTLWQQARTLADLADLTARWLEGDPLVGSHPGYPDSPGEPEGPDPETAPLVVALAAVNRAGLLTVCSQPGEQSIYEGSLCEQFAAVEGWTRDLTLFTRLLALAEKHSLMAIPHRPGIHGPMEDGVTVTLYDHEPFTTMGAYPHEDIVREEMLPDCGPDAVADVLAGWFITLIDPQVGRNDRLWPALAALAGDDSQTGARER